MSVSPYPVEQGTFTPRQGRELRVVRPVIDRAPLPFLDQFTRVLPADLAGCSVLDVGGGDAFRAIEMKRRGASRVVVMDTTRDAKQGSDAAGIAGCEDIEFRRRSIYEITALEQEFDVVIYAAPLTQLRHPLLALDMLRQVSGGTMLFRVDATDVAADTPDHDTHPLLYAAQPARTSTWWQPNRACVEAMLASAGFAIEDRVHDGIYICRPA